MGRRLSTNLLYCVSSDGGTVEPAKFEWDKMDYPFLSWCLLCNLLEVGEVLHDQTSRPEDGEVKCTRVISVTFSVLPPYRIDRRPVWTEGVHTENPDPVLHEFCGNFSGEIWVEEVGLGSRPRKPSVPTRPNQEDLVPLTSLADFFFVFRQMIPLDPEAVFHANKRADIDYDRPTNQPIQRDLVYLLPIFIEMVGCVDVSACVGTEVESVNSEPVSCWELESGLGGELWVVRVCVNC